MTTAPTKSSLKESPLADLIKNYSHYNYWANLTLIDWLKTKSSEALQKTIPSSFAGIELTLRHLWRTEEFWLDIIKDEKGGAHTDSKVDVPEPTLIELFDLLLENSLEFLHYAKQLDQDSLAKKIHVISPWFECNISRYEFILHTVNHSTYHRGQITSIGRRLGFTDAPMTDYNFFLIHQTNVF